MTPEALEAIHQSAFVYTRAWTASEFSRFLESPLCFLVTKGESFALGRVIGPEAELLTLAVAPTSQGQGLGRDCLNQFEGMARRKGAEECFLEVSADNKPAISLYKTNGYSQVSTRGNYYQTKSGEKVDALIFGKSLFS
jgi:ribosomal-protein-alanine N-acetyltransferase